MTPDKGCLSRSHVIPRHDPLNRVYSDLREDQRHDFPQHTI